MVCEVQLQEHHILQLQQALQQQQLQQQRLQWHNGLCITELAEVEALWAAAAADVDGLGRRLRMLEELSEDSTRQLALRVQQLERALKRFWWDVHSCRVPC